MNNIANIEQFYCPFWDCRALKCQVSFSNESVGSRRYLYHCTSDDHDNCPLYLAEALRRSRIRNMNNEPAHSFQG